MLIQMMTVLVESGIFGRVRRRSIRGLTRACRRRAACRGRGRRPDQQGEERQRHQHEGAHPQEGIAPADGADRLAAEIGDQALAQRLAARDDPDGETDAAFEPPAGIGDHWRKQAAAADETADEENRVELPQRVGAAGEQHRQPHRDAAEHDRPADADGFGNPAHDDAADGDAGQAREIDERHRPAAPAEFLFQRYEKDRHAVQDQPQTARHHDGGCDDDDPAIAGLGRGGGV